MTQQNPANGPAPDPSRVPAKPLDPGAKSPHAPRRKSGWVKKILLGIVILVILLLVFAGFIPTLLSTGAGRTFAVGRVNGFLNGHIAVTDWSLDWTSGMRLDGVKVFDDTNRQIAEIAHFNTSVSLVGAMRGQIHLGKTVVDGLNFFAERYPDGTLNFSRLAKSSEPKAHAESEEKAAKSKEKDEDKSAAPAHTATTSPSPSAPKSPSKLPNLDGEIQLTNCRGTFQTDSVDPKTNQPRQDALQFTSIEGDVKIPSINDPITDSLKITVDSGAQLSGTISADGHIQLAKDNRMIDFSRLSELDINQTVTVSSIGLAAAMGLVSPAPAIKVVGGTVSASVAIARNKDGHLQITPGVDAKDVVLSNNGVQDPIGAIALHGAIVVPPASGASAGSASMIDQVGAIVFDKLAFTGAGAGVTLNGSVADFMHARNIQNLTVDLAYDAAVLWKNIYPLMSAEQQAKLKGTQVAGNYTKHIALGGNYPADVEYYQAITHLTAGGDIQIDLFDGEGVTLKNLIVPFALAGGKFTVAYADKPAGQNFAPPAELNGGKLVLAGLSADLADPHMKVSIPAGTKLLENVSLNKILASNIGDFVNNPLMIDADSAAGQLTLTINTCEAVPVDDTLNEQTDANKGVLDLTMIVSRIQLGNPTLNKIAAALSFGGKQLSVTSLQGNLNPLHAHIARGITTEEMVINLAQHNRSLGLDGKVVMKTRMVDMTVNLPLITFGVQSLPGVGDQIKFPLTGPANNPKFDISKAIKDNFKVNPQDLVNGFLNKGNKSNDTPQGDQPKKDDPIGDILGQFSKKKKQDQNK